MTMTGPRRIVCLTEEPTEVLYALGEEARIVGISGFTVRPPRARREKPKVSAFTRAKTGAILALEPDLVIGFSDIQADIARDLVGAGVEVWIANHRSVEGILDYIRRLGALVGASVRRGVRGRAEAHLAAVAASAATLPRRPRVYFEEWDEPIFVGIRWVAELIRIAGGDDIFPERAPPVRSVAAASSPTPARWRRAPDLILAWCGKKFQPERLAERPGWSSIPAVRDGELHEIKSPIILQPGPAALFDGLAAIHAASPPGRTAHAEHGGGGAAGRPARSVRGEILAETQGDRPRRIGGRDRQLEGQVSGPASSNRPT